MLTMFGPKLGKVFYKHPPGHFHSDQLNVTFVCYVVTVGLGQINYVNN